MSQSLGHVTSQSPCQILTGASAGLAPRLGKRAGQLGETWNSAAAAPRQPRRRPQRWCRPTGSRPPSPGCTGPHRSPQTGGDHGTFRHATANVQPCKHTVARRGCLRRGDNHRDRVQPEPWVSGDAVRPLSLSPLVSGCAPYSFSTASCQ